jgi:two-component system nitrate/nitrite response regulator NarL
MVRPSEIDPQITLLVAESCAMNCELMTTALARDENLTVTASALTAADILRVYEEKKPDVCVVSADLKDGPSAGFGASKELRAIHPGARIILLLNSSDRADVVEAFRAGALGVFSREEPFGILCKSIKRVHQGQIWASNQQLRYLVETLTITPAPPITDAQGASLLTKREQSLVQLVAEGHTNKDISRELGLSEHTVRNYLFRIFNKLGTSNRLELALYAINHRETQREQPVASD